MKLRYLASILFSALLVMLPVTSHAQSFTDTTFTFTALTAAGSTSSYSTIPEPLTGAGIIYPRVQTVQAFVIGAPTTCSFQVFGSTKRLSESPVSTDFQPLGVVTDCTTTKLIFLVDQPVATIQVRLSVLSGGTAPTVIFRYLGKR